MGVPSDAILDLRTWEGFEKFLITSLVVPASQAFRSVIFFYPKSATLKVVGLLSVTLSLVPGVFGVSCGMSELCNT